MAAADDIRSFLVTDLAFLSSLPQTGAPFIYPGQEWSEAHPGNQHVRVRWISTQDLNRAQGAVRHVFEIGVSVRGQDTKPTEPEATRTKHMRQYVEELRARYDGRPDRFRASPPDVLCYRAAAVQAGEIDLGADPSTEREVFVALVLDTHETS